MICAIASCLAYLLLPLALSAAEVRLGWRANAEPDVAGYRLYHGPSSRNYTNTLNIAGRLTTNATVQVSGRRYFALTAFATNGLESDFTPELVYNPPPPTVSVPQGFNGNSLWLVTEQSCDFLFWEPTLTNEVASYWPAEVFRQRMERKTLLP